MSKPTGPENVGMSGEGSPETNAIRNTTSGLTGVSLSGGGGLAESLNSAQDESTDTNAQTAAVIGERRSQYEASNPPDTPTQRRRRARVY